MNQIDFNAWSGEWERTAFLMMRCMRTFWRSAWGFSISWFWRRTGRPGDEETDETDETLRTQELSGLSMRRWLRRAKPNTNGRLSSTPCLEHILI